jgi:hypothetical protein
MKLFKLLKKALKLAKTPRSEIVNEVSDKIKKDDPIVEAGVGIALDLIEDEVKKAVKKRKR